MFCTDLIMASNRKFEVHSNFMSQSIKQIVPGLHSANNLNIVWPGQIYEIAVNWNMRPHEHFNNYHTTKATSKVGRTTVLPIIPQSYYTSRLKKTQFQCTPWGYRKTIKMIENVNVIYINRKIIVSWIEWCKNIS